MSRQIIIIALMLFIFSGFTNRESPPNSMKKLDWVLGSWQAQTKRGVITETWRELNDSTFIGENKILRTSGETSIIETLTFTSRNGQYYYTPTVLGQNDNKPIPFRLTSFNETGFVAENPNHDFPKRIIYQLISKDTIHAVIDAGLSEPGKKADFFYSRVKK